MMPMTNDTGDVFEPFGSYLQVLAELHLDRRQRGKSTLHTPGESPVLTVEFDAG
jgi:hypothetical protein